MPSSFSWLPAAGIHGRNRAERLLLRNQSDQVRIRSDFPLNLKDYKIGGLTKLMGMLRMYENIKVHVDVTFKLGQ